MIRFRLKYNKVDLEIENSESNFNENLEDRLTTIYKDLYNECGESFYLLLSEINKSIKENEASYSAYWLKYNISDVVDLKDLPKFIESINQYNIDSLKKMKEVSNSVEKESIDIIYDFYTNIVK